MKILPWNDMPLAKETQVIQSDLAEVNHEGVLTTNSQPRINGLPSTDPVFGWGQPGGYIYQKVWESAFIRSKYYTLTSWVTMRLRPGLNGTNWRVCKILLVVSFSHIICIITIDHSAHRTSIYQKIHCRKYSIFMDISR